jgi:membrane protein involved in colicin uptake
MTDHESQASQADEAAQSQADEAAQSQADHQSETISLDEAKKLRTEAASLRKRLRDAESKVQAAEDAKKPELDRLLSERDRYKADMEAAQKRAQDKAGKSAAIEAARAANAISATAIYALVRDRIEYDDDDEPTNLERLIADARKAEPSLFQASAGSGDGGRGNNGKTPVDGPSAINQLLRQGAGYSV